MISYSCMQGDTMQALAICHPPLQSGAQDAGLLRLRALAWAEIGEWERSLKDFRALDAQGMDVQTQVRALEKRLPPKHTKKLFSVLALPASSSSTEVKAAFRRLALKLHPDKQALGGNACGAYEELFIILTEAKEVLADEAQRSFYQKRLQVAESLFTPFSDLAGSSAPGSIPHQGSGCVIS